LADADSLARRSMQKSLKSAEYGRLIEVLVAARHETGIRQQALATKLERPQSFVAKYEGGERRIDVIEFIAIARALGADPLKLFKEFLAEKPVKSPRKRTR
jgi:transcriptional regulator with XRE-family HTH domain